MVPETLARPDGDGDDGGDTRGPADGGTLPLRPRRRTGTWSLLRPAKLAFLALRVCAGAVRQFAQLQLSRIGRKLTGAGAA